MEKHSAGRTRTEVLGLATALPPYSFDQAELASFMSRSLRWPPKLERFARRVFETSGVQRRHMALPDFGDPAGAVLYRDKMPTLRDRMAVYSREAPRLAVSACRSSLESGATAADEITHLVVVTSTGIAVPGIDVAIADCLGLRTGTARTLISMMGCAGAFHGLRAARTIAESDPQARVLVVCVEICSIHMDSDPQREKVVAHSLFADGAAAAIVSQASDGEVGIAEMGDEATLLAYEARDLVQWGLAEDRFDIVLSPKLASEVGARIGSFAKPLVDAGGPIDSWVVHPGGPAVIRQIEANLSLQPQDLDDSREVLRTNGNLSSATVLFVLERVVARASSGMRSLMVGFGPGLSFDALTLTHRVGGQRS